MRRAARIDANQTQIVTALKAAGASVQSLAAIGKGVPDLLVAFRGLHYLLEVKDGAKPPSHRGHTTAQRNWTANWGGTVHTVTGPEAALKAIGVL